MSSTAAASCAVQLRLELTFILDDKGIPACTNTGFAASQSSPNNAWDVSLRLLRGLGGIGLLLSLWLYWELSAHKRVVGARSIALRARLCTTAVDLFVWTTLAAETLGLQSL